MSFHTRVSLPSSEEINDTYPITSDHKVTERRRAISEIIERSDSRLMIITGPCSAYPSDSVRKYSDALVELSDEVSSVIQLVLRTYIQKPRTTVGWPGPLNQPDPLLDPNIVQGIHECRRLLTDVAVQHPLADEMLFTHNADYFSPALSYMALGARSAEDMEHRYIASGIDMPVGVKNPTSGDIAVGVNGVLAVQSPHTFAYRQEQVSSSGNPYAHLILRGGTESSNYGPRSIAKANKLLCASDVHNPAIVVDASHDNSRNGSGKDPLLQEHVIRDVMLGISQEREEYKTVVGFMMESYIEGGKQSISSNMNPNVSITDPCLSWEDTQRIIRNAADQLS